MTRGVSAPIVRPVAGRPQEEALLLTVAPRTVSVPGLNVPGRQGARHKEEGRECCVVSRPAAYEMSSWKEKPGGVIYKASAPTPKQPSMRLIA
jgi:hypothetical protein